MKKSWMQVSAAANACDRNDQLLIARVLQVLGEYLKNTLESPKLSTATTNLLLLCLPQNTRRIVLDLRNSLSHCNSLAKRKEIEDTENERFFSNIQNDLNKINNMIIDILFKKNLRTLRQLVSIISETETFDDLRKLSQVFQAVPIGGLFSKCSDIKEYKLVHELVDEFKEAIKDKTPYEEGLFREIDMILGTDLRKLIKLNNSNEHYIKGYSLLAGIKGILDTVNMKEIQMRLTRFTAKTTLEAMAGQTKQGDLKKVTELVILIANSAVIRSIQNEEKDKISELAHEIYHTTVFDLDNIRWIEDLRDKLGKSEISTSHHSKGKHQTRNYSAKESTTVINQQLALKLNMLEEILKSKNLTQRNFNEFSICSEQPSLVVKLEMLVLDILSILGSSKFSLKDNLMYLDQASPLLLGRNLRNHLAHGNSVFDISPYDPSNAVIINAIKLSVENIATSNKRIGNPIKDNPHKLKKKFQQDLVIIENQKCLFIALADGDLEQVNNSIKKGAEINASDITNGWTALHFAAKGSNIEVFKFVLSKNICVQTKDINQRTALHIAASHGSASIVEYLLKKLKVPVDDQDIGGKTALHLAAQKDFIDVVTILLKYKADHLMRDNMGLSPLYFAIHNSSNIAKIMLDREPDVNINITKHNYPALDTASDVGYVDLVRYLIERKANVNAKTDTGMTPLHSAALHGNLDVVKILIANGAKVNARLYDGCTPLHYAVEEGFDEVVEFLLKNGALVNAVSKLSFISPMYYAAKHGYPGITDLLIKHKADVNILTNIGLSPLETAARFGHIDIVRLLLKSDDILIDGKANDGHTALHITCAMGHKGIAELLISKGADIHATDNNNKTALHSAAATGQKDIIDMLLKAGSNVNCTNFSGNSALHFCCKGSNEDILGILEVASPGIKHNYTDATRLLITAGADINAEDQLKNTPLHFAVTSGSLEIIKILISAGARPNSANSKGLTALHLAAERGDITIAKFLIEHSAEVNFGSETGLTPLMIAINANKSNVVKLLVENGADVESCSDKGANPLGIATLNNNKTIVDILLKHGADPNSIRALPAAVHAGRKNILNTLLNHKNADSMQTDNYFLLHYAVEKGSRQIVEALLDHGAEVDAFMKWNGKNITPLFIAVSNNKVDIAELLIKRGADVNLQDDDIMLLHEAAYKGYTDMTKLLLENHAKPNSLNCNNIQAVELAASKGHLEIMKMLLEHRDINIAATHNGGITLLHIAAQEGQLEVTKYLVEHGANVHARNNHESKPILIAARDGHKDIVEFYLNHDRSLINDDLVHWSLLHYSSQTNEAEVVEYLCQQKADVNAVDMEKRTPLHIAAKFGRKKIIGILLNSGAYYNPMDLYKATPLMLSTDKDTIDILKVNETLFENVKSNKCALVEKGIKEGACANLRNAKKSTVLQYASWKGYEEIVNVLLQNKADPDMIGNNGCSAIHFAAKFGHYNIVRALLSHGAMFDMKCSSGKTALNFTQCPEIINLLALLEKLFLGVKNCNSDVISDLKKVKDINTVKAIMRARDKDKKTLIVVATQNDFPKTKQLKEVLQDSFSDYYALAQVLIYEEKFEEVLNIYKMILEKRKEILGPNNPGTLDIRQEIASILFKLHRYKEDLEINEEILDIQKKIFGMNHKETLKTRSNIAFLIHRLGRDEEALIIFREVYKKQKEILETCHVDMIQTSCHMALVLDNLRKYEEALEINREMYESQKLSLGANHPSTLITQNNMAMVLSKSGKFEEALKIYRMIYETRKKLLGENHSDTLRVLSNIAHVYSLQGNMKESLKQYEVIYKKQKAAIGATHIDKLYSLIHIAHFQFEDHRFVSALQNYEQVLPLYEAIVGPDHPDIQAIRRNIEVIHMAYDNKIIKGTHIAQFMRQDLLTAADMGDIESIEHLIEKGVNVNIKDKDGRTPLHFAVNKNHLGVVRMLLENHADCTLCSDKGNTPLHTAAAKGNQEIVEFFLKHVREKYIEKFEKFVNEKTVISESSAMHIAAKNNHVGIVKILLRYGACYKPVDNMGKTPVDVSNCKNVIVFLKFIDELFEKLEKGNSEAIRKLENMRKFDLLSILNARNSQSHTLLQQAIVYGNSSVINNLSKIINML